MKKAIFSMLLLAVFFASCKKDEPDPPVTTDPTADDVQFLMGHLWGTAPFNLGTAYVTADGDTATFTRFKYYVSNVRLRRTDGTEWVPSESYYLIDEANASSTTMVLPAVPAGSYNQISFLLGVDSVRNYSGAQTGALDIVNGMFWSWNSGYIFSKLEGSSSAVPGAFNFHLGGFKAPYVASRTVTLSFGTEVLAVDGTKNVTPQIHVNVDVKNFFGGPNVVDLATTNDVVVPGAAALLCADNFVTSFTFDHLHQ